MPLAFTVVPDCSCALVFEDVEAAALSIPGATEKPRSESALVFALCELSAFTRPPALRLEFDWTCAFVLEEVAAVALSTPGATEKPRSESALVLALCESSAFTRPPALRLEFD